MRTDQGPLASWIDLVDELLRHPHRRFPQKRVRDELSATFDTVAAWSWTDANFNAGFEMTGQPAGWPPPGEQQFCSEEVMPEHPIMHWFLTSRDPTAITLARVPSSVGTRRGRERLHSVLRPVRMEHQLVMPFLFTGGPESQCFTLGTGGADYTDGQLDLARRIQPMLVLLARQHRVLDPVLAAQPATQTVNGARADLTGREHAVLCLLAGGLTAVAIGHRLGISPGTVRKHLENLYRKLDVNDRMMAVLRGNELGLLDPDHSGAPT